MSDIPHIEIIRTDDGSHSLFLPALNETYHSRHGALRESRHVFIENGFMASLEKQGETRVLEVGFGTGLNTWLTANESLQKQRSVHYTTLETFPLQPEVYTKLNYADNASENAHILFLKIHESGWEQVARVHDFFTLLKRKCALQYFEPVQKFNLVYYDAFGPPAQPEMWERPLFEKISSMMDTAGILVTYCAKGQVRRDLQASGFRVERLPGPPGKREMIRAIKL